MPHNKIDKREPDINFVIDNRQYVIDVAFCKNKASQMMAFNNKIKKYNILGKGQKPLYDED